MAVLVHQLVDREQPAQRITPDDTGARALPAGFRGAPPLQEIAVGERRLVLALGEVEEDVQRIEVGAEVRVEALVDRQQLVGGQGLRQRAIGLADAVAVIPGLDHALRVRVAPGLEDLDEPALHVRRRDADGFRGRVDLRAFLRRLLRRHADHAPPRAVGPVAGVQRFPQRIEGVEQQHAPLGFLDLVQELKRGAAVDDAALEREVVAELAEAADERGAQSGVVEIGAAGVRALRGGGVVRGRGAGVGVVRERGADRGEGGGIGG